MDLPADVDPDADADPVADPDVFCESEVVDEGRAMVPVAGVRDVESWVDVCDSEELDALLINLDGRPSILNCGLALSADPYTVCCRCM